MPKKSTIPPASPLATFMKGLIDSKKFDCTEIVSDNPKRLSASSLRPPLQTSGDSQRWGSQHKIDTDCINCPQRRASIDDDDPFFSDYECSDDEDDDDDMNSHTTSTTSTPLPRAPLSPPFENTCGKGGMSSDSNSDKSSLPYQMALRMVQQKYAATSISSPTQSPLQPPKKLCPDSRGEGSFRR